MGALVAVSRMCPRSNANPDMNLGTLQTAANAEALRYMVVLVHFSRSPAFSSASSAGKYELPTFCLKNRLGGYFSTLVVVSGLW